MKGNHYNKKTKNKKKKLKRGIITTVLLIIFLAIFIYSAYQVIFWIKSNSELKALEDGIFSEVVTELPNEGNQVGAKTHRIKSIDFEKLNQVNNETIAWICIEDTNINYPIVQAEDNEYYLKRDIYRQKNSCGTIFLDCDTKPDFTDNNTVIYGHNLKSGGMFADLNKIYGGNLGENIQIDIYTKDNMYTYQVVTAYVAEPSLDIVKRNFATEKERKQYLDKAIKRSSVKFQNPTEANGDIITLITCYGDQRVVVSAVKIKTDAHVE